MNEKEDIRASKQRTSETWQSFVESYRKVLNKKTTLYNLFLENYSGCCVKNKLQKGNRRKRIIFQEGDDGGMTKMTETEDARSGQGFKG